jgi:hypothetical protein
MLIIGEANPSDRTKDQRAKETLENPGHPRDNGPVIAG